MDESSSPLPALWSALGGDARLLERVSLNGPRHVLPSVYDVTGFAAATIAAATLAAAELLARRTGGDVADVAVDRVHACAAFRSEALFTPIGWDRLSIWDPVAGDYRAADGWIRLHTNYRYHSDAALSVLGVSAERRAVEAAVARWAKADLETAVVDAGGCAAAMYTRDEWRAHPHGAEVEGEPAIALEFATAKQEHRLAELAKGAALPLEGIRVLDLTRVLAGPGCTRFLAAYGADVLRIDPPGFEEVPAIVPDTTAGKRCAALDLANATDRARFEALVREAHVLVHGLRPGALERLGLDAARLRAKNPGLVIAMLDAYGWRGPWSGRRGFDSLVQMSCGIAAAGAAARGADRPVPLPAQALDHGVGYLLAAGVCRALTQCCERGDVGTVRGALIGAAHAIMNGPAGDLATPAPTWPDDVFEPVETPWGSARRVRCPGTMGGRRPTWTRAPGPLGRDEPQFE